MKGKFQSGDVVYNSRYDFVGTIVRQTWGYHNGKKYIWGYHIEGHGNHTYYAVDMVLEKTRMLEEILR